MKHSTHVLLAVGFIASSLLGGLVATALAPADVMAAPLQAFGPQVKLTTLPVPRGEAIAPKNGTWIKVGDIGIFAVENPESIVEITFEGNLSISDSGDGQIVTFRMGVDGQPPIDPVGGFRMFDFSPYFEWASFSQTWQDLSAGSHTVSLYAKTSGSALYNHNVNMNFFNFNNPPDKVTVKEYLPFGTTYIPAVQR